MKRALSDGASPGVLREAVIVVIAGLLGALFGLVIFQLGNPGLVRSAGGTVGSETIARGWVALTAAGVLLAIPFAVIVAGSVNAFVEMVIAFTSGSDSLRAILVALLHVSALGLTLFGMGLLYGLAVGVAVFAIGVPVWTILAAKPALPPSFLDIVGMVGSTIYGGVMGLSYGVLKER